MKIQTNFDKEEEVFLLPVIAVGYNYKEKELAIVFMFACWAFTIEICF